LPNLHRIPWSKKSIGGGIAGTDGIDGIIGIRIVGIDGIIGTRIVGTGGTGGTVTGNI
jgi:hypothetical protein